MVAEGAGESGTGLGGAAGKLATGDRLPSVHLVSAESGGVVDLRASKGPRALVAMHSLTCRACREYVREELAPGARAIAEWGGRLTVVVPGGIASAAGFAETTTGAIEVLADTGRAFAPDRAVVTIADQWGEVYFAADGGAGHDLPRCADVVEWIRFLAIQCPECEGPEGEWRSIP